MKELTKIEETILISIWHLKENAYGITIKNKIFEMINREYLYSSLYSTLDQMVSKGYIRKRFGEPTAMRGGKRKIFFNITETGMNALKNALEQQRSVWNGITKEIFNAR